MESKTLLESFIADTVQQMGTELTLSNFCNWLILRSFTEDSGSYLRSVSELLLNLCTTIKISRNNSESICWKMANNLFLFSYELRDTLETWITAVDPDDSLRYRGLVRKQQNKLLDELKRFDKLCSWSEFQEWANQQANSPTNAMKKTIQNGKQLINNVRKVELIDELSKLPVTETQSGRTSLLDGIPSTDTLTRSASIKRHDLDLIVTQLAERARMANGELPLIKLIDNALPYARGFEGEEKLENIKQQLLST